MRRENALLKMENDMHYRADFMGLLGNQFYGMPLMAPSEFLENEREKGRLR